MKLTRNKNGHTVCWECLRTVTVKDGKIGYHVSGHWEKKCKTYGELARWVETGDGSALNAMGRNPAGFCMKCEQHISEGPNLDCTQCCYEKRNAD